MHHLFIGQNTKFFIESVGIESRRSKLIILDAQQF